MIELLREINENFWKFARDNSEDFKEIILIIFVFLVIVIALA